MGAKCSTWCSYGTDIERGNIARKRTNSSAYMSGIENSSSSGSSGDSNDGNVDLGTPSITTAMSVRSARITHDGFKKAIKNGNDSLVSHFIDTHPTLNLLDIGFQNGDNCLHVAVSKKHYNLVYYLLTHGLSPNAQNKLNDETALHTAVRTRDLKIVTLLFQFGADPKVSNVNKETPITIASNNKDDDIIELLAPHTMKLIKSLNDNDRLNSLRLHTMADDILKDDDDDDDDLNRYDSNRLHQTTQDILNDDDGDIDFQIAQLQNIIKYKSITKSFGNSVNKSSSLLSSFESKLDDNEKTKLEIIRIQQLNPFSKIKRTATKKLLHEFNELTIQKSNLPILGAYMEKRKHHPPYSFQKRWVVVKESYILWSDKKRAIGDVKNVQERNKWNNNINLMSIRSIKPVSSSKSKNKFVFYVGKKSDNTKKKYVWKCPTKKDRDHWMLGLKQHVIHVKSMLKYLGTKGK